MILSTGSNILISSNYGSTFTAASGPNSWSQAISASASFQYALVSQYNTSTTGIMYWTNNGTAGASATWSTVPGMSSINSCIGLSTSASGQYTIGATWNSIIFSSTTNASSVSGVSFSTLTSTNGLPSVNVYHSYWSACAISANGQYQLVSLLVPDGNNANSGLYLCSNYAGTGYQPFQ